MAIMTNTYDINEKLENFKENILKFSDQEKWDKRNHVDERQEGYIFYLNNHRYTITKDNRDHNTVWRIKLKPNKFSDNELTCYVQSDRRNSILYEDEGKNIYLCRKTSQIFNMPNIDNDSLHELFEISLINKNRIINIDGINYIKICNIVYSQHNDISKINNDLNKIIEEYKIVREKHDDMNDLYEDKVHMPITNDEFQKLLTQCNKLEDGPDYRIDDYVTNLMNTVLDFKMNIGPFGSAMRYFKDKHNFSTHEELKRFIDQYPNTNEGNLQLANEMWNNNHWSRAKFLRMLLNEFEKRGITDQQSLKNWMLSADFKTDIKGQFKTDEHSIGIALFEWLRLRLGADTVKPDVHIMNFVTNAVGRKVSPKEARDALLIVAQQTSRRASLLDSAIWHYQRNNA